MSKNKIWELIAKKLSGEATEEDLASLESLLKANPDMHYPIQTVADLWHHATPDTEDAQAAFSRHADRVQAMGLDIQPPELPAYIENRSPIKKYWLAAAAVVLALLGYFSYSYIGSSSAKTMAKAVSVKSEVSTKYGSRTKLVLPDGTQVWLNSGSKLTYDKSYGNGLREVALSGEAFFDVVKNPGLPFVIHTISIDIRVLGTAFNVKSFPGEKNTETSLIRGSIEVTFKNRPTEKIILKPNEKLITANDDTVRTHIAAGHTQDNARTATQAEQAKPEPIVMVSHLTYEPRDSTVIETSWMDNKLIFRSETLEELAVKMERWYGVSIRFADEDIKPRKVTGIFENETIQQALKALQLITPFNYKIYKNDIIISSR